MFTVSSTRQTLHDKIIINTVFSFTSSQSTHFNLENHETFVKDPFVTFQFTTSDQETSILVK